MAVTLHHPFYTPARGLTMADVPLSVSLNTTLRHGVSAWVELPAVRRVDLPVTIWGDTAPVDAPVGKARFRVPIRRLVPLSDPPELGARDPQVIEWLAAHDWLRAVEGAEARWLELNAGGVLRRAANARDRAEAREVELRRREDAAQPGFGDELLTQTGEVVEQVAEGAKGAAKAVKSAGSGVWTAIKVGAGVGAGVLIINALRRRR